MKQIFIFLCFLGFVTACQNKKYDPESYKVGLSEENLSNDASSKLWEEYVVFMNYCDRNHTSNLKLFARDWIRTWKGWKTDGIKDYGSGPFCTIKTKYWGKAIYLEVNTDKNPPVFKAKRLIFHAEYDDFVDLVRGKFGNPDEENETQYGPIYKWYINDAKAIKTVPKHGVNEFILEYILND